MCGKNEQLKNNPILNWAKNWIDFAKEDLQLLNKHEKMLYIISHQGKSKLQWNTTS